MRTFFTLCILAALPGTLAAQPKILATSLNPVTGHDSNHGSTIASPQIPNMLTTSGFHFTPSETAHLDAIEVAVGLISGGNAFRMSLRAADGPGGGPGTVLETFHVKDKMKPFGTRYPIIRLESSSERLLKAGTTYWLVGTADGDTVAAWNLGDRPIIGIFYSIQAGGDMLLPNQNVGAFQVFGTPVKQK